MSPLRLRAVVHLVFTLLLANSILSAAPTAITPPELQGAIQPQVAVTPSGRIHIAFGRADVVYHLESADGRTFSRPVQVAQLPKLALGMRRGPRIIASDRVVAITAISHGDGDLHAWSSNDGGVTWKTGSVINDAPKSAREGLHAMASNGNDRAFVTWLDLRNKGTELWTATSSDGGVTWGANSRLYESPDGHICECCHPNVAMDAKGRVAVMWRNWVKGSRDMYAVISPDGGRTFASAQKLGSGTWKLDGCPMDGGAISIGPSGKPLTAWRRETTIFASGLAETETRLADSAIQPVVVAGNAGAYYFWENAGDLILKRGDAPPAKFAHNAKFAAAARLPSGAIFVAWESQAGGKNTLLGEIVE